MHAPRRPSLLLVLAVLVGPLTANCADSSDSVSTAPPSSAATRSETQSDLGLLYLPSALPTDLSLCVDALQARALARFCSDEDPNRWIQVTLQPSHEVPLGAGTGEPTVPGARWLPTQPDRLIVAVPLARFHVLTLLGKTVTAAELLSAVESVPTLVDPDLLVGEYEKPLDVAALTDSQLENLIGPGSSVVRTSHDDGSTTVFLDGSTLLIVDGALNPLSEFAFTLDMPRALEGLDRPVAIGESADGVIQLAWQQRGWLWSLETRWDQPSAIVFAEQLISRVGGT